MEKTELRFDDGRTLSIETGRVARQAGGSVMVRLGDTIVLIAVTSAPSAVERDFFPLTVDYREKSYAAGKIPGGFFKREGRPTEKEILSARLTDRPIRPLFPDGYTDEVQIMIQVLSSDQENDGDILGIIGASAALAVSDIPFHNLIGAVRVGRVDGRFIADPLFSELEKSDMNITVVGTRDHIMMVEGGAQEVSEKDMVDALAFGHEQVKNVVATIEELAAKAGKPKKEITPVPLNPEIVQAVNELAAEKVKTANRIREKKARGEAIEAIKTEIKEALAERFPESEKVIARVIDDIERTDLREMILSESIRSDGRGLTDIRDISIEIGILPRTHGSAIFTRGQTQALVVTTLGTKMDEQRIDDLLGESFKSYMLHYNFPSYSVGEVRPIRGPGRREIGHGALAERALDPVIPAEEKFPYTIRIVSDILESNGSSSMATVCGGSLALMDAGVPIKAPVAGIAMGLVMEGNRQAILSDILGVEDHLGDMDFKVTGTADGITAFQLDIKIGGLTIELMSTALEQARQGRLYILDKMNQAISAPKPELSPYAPRIITIKIPIDKIGEVIGPGGKMIRSIIEATGAKIDIEDDGTVTIASVDQLAGEAARDRVLALTEEAEMGRIYTGKVKRIAAFGAFVEILPNVDGLVHISELDNYRVGRVEDVVNLGDEIKVKVIGIDPEGKVRLSRRVLLEPGSGDDRSGGGGDRSERSDRNNDRRPDRNNRPRRD
ncbi:MAG TPA: polyribonucleotide nucleotidyltransferase [candidate division Zixibacteria bacterium]|nr:polyribonucleotide nucleotidyltransferase [candidate division Zixibacteria bacterium]